MAVLKYKNPNYVVGGTEEKYLPLFNVIVGSSEIYIGEEEPTNGCLIWINPTDNITKYKYNDTWVKLINFQETVTISLVSNQDEIAIPDPDLLGKVIHVIYGDQDKELIWQGEPLKVTIPMNMTYRVVFPTNEHYTWPAQQEYIAKAGNTRKVKGLYYTEVVTVNVICDDSTSAEGQQVTINETVYDVDATGSVTAKIPFDVEYTVSVNTKSGYTSPSSVTETANSKSKTISMEYTLIAYGVFIEATDGTLHRSTRWTGAKIANSIVVKQPTTSFRIALTQSSTKLKINSYASDSYDNYMESFRKADQAITDMKSSENTANMIKVKSDTSYAAGYCNSFTFPDGKTKGLLPASGWWQVAYDNKTSIDACIAACGGTAIDTSWYHWASTYERYDAISAYCAFWAIGWKEGNVGTAPVHTNEFWVRPFAEYN